MGRARTGKEFDSWFNQSNGDPWGYDGERIQKRLHRSFEFLKKNLKPETDILIEFGAFNGDFTEKLVKDAALPIFCNDISSVALSKIKSRFSDIPAEKLNFIEGDLLSIDLNVIRSFKRPAVLLLECLYYLNKNEQHESISRLIRDLSSPSFFISGPVLDGYLNEDELKSMFPASYKLVKIEVLNLKRGDRFFNLITPILNRSKLLRQSCANQVIYLFSKENS